MNGDAYNMLNGNLNNLELRKIIDYIDVLLYNRPLPIRQYDQIYMRAIYMLDQTDYIEKYISKKNIVFLGDGDGMSLLISMFSQNKAIDVSGITVMDFDERIIDSFKKTETNCINKKFPVNYYLYNVINPVENDLISTHDFFYINPPYGSKNNGLSCILWLYRCMDLCTDTAEGCIIIPDDERFPWTRSSAENIYNFLSANGFEIIDKKYNAHLYHLDDNPQLYSSAIIVRRTTAFKSPYRDRKFPFSMVKNMYGKIRPIPQYIYIDTENPLGRKDLKWEYGNINNYINDTSGIVGDNHED